MFLRLGKLLQKRIEGYSFKKELLALKVLESWDDVLNDLFEKNMAGVKPLFFKQGTLWVRVSNSNIAQELQLQKQEVIQRINKKLKKDIVKNIIFRIQ